MVHLNIQQIPPRYLLQRWVAAAITPTPDPGANIMRFGVPPTNTLRYNSFCRKLNDLASDACYNYETYVVVSGMVDEARKLIAVMRRPQNEEKLKGKDHVPGDNPQAALLLEDGDAPPSSPLKTPPRTKPKGHPKEKEKGPEATD
jgi:hypothetical protein